MSAEENLGVGTGWRMAGNRIEPPFKLLPPVKNYVGCITLHQGGIVQIQSGEWWGWSMMDHNSVGRLVCLSPVTWQNGWPFFGLPGNLTRSPRTWVKPNTGFTSVPKVPYERNDDFSGPKLKNVWQWNHVPDDKKWSLSERKGYLRLHSLPAENFWHAKNSLTQRGIGPESTGTTEVEIKNLKSGDIAGLALLNLPYAWIGIEKDDNGYKIKCFDQTENHLTERETKATKIWFRAHCNFDTDVAYFSYSLDGVNFERIGNDYIMVYQLVTFQGVRFSLFNYNTKGQEGGYADFNSFEIVEPRCHGLTKPIPYGQVITLISLADSSLLVNWKDFLRPVPVSSGFARGNASQFKVVDKGNGRIALQSVVDGGFVTVVGNGGIAEIRIEKDDKGDASTFQWQDMLQGDLMLMSIITHQYLFVDSNARSLCAANSPGARPDRKDGSCFVWKVVNK
jgi:hypothetical protein